MQYVYKELGEWTTYDGQLILRAFYHECECKHMNLKFIGTIEDGRISYVDRRLQQRMDVSDQLDHDIETGFKRDSWAQQLLFDMGIMG